MSYKKPFEKPTKVPDKYGFPLTSMDKNKYTSSKYNNPNLSDSSKSSKKDDLESSKDADNVSVSSHELDDSEVSISNKSEILNNLNDGSENLSNPKTDESLSDIEKSEDEIPTKEKNPKKNVLPPPPEPRNNFSFEERKHKEESFSSKPKFNDYKPKIAETQKIEEIRNKYSSKKQKNNDDKEPEFKGKEKKSETHSFAPRIFNEIKQINSEIDDLEKELEKTFKFYNNK